jgi:hypothetical protein
MSTEDEITGLIMRGKTPSEIVAMGYAKSTVYQTYNKMRAASLSAPMRLWDWSINSTFDRPRYLPGDLGYVDLRVRNSGSVDLYLSQVGIQFDWLENSWLSIPIKIHLNSGEEQHLPRLHFTVPSTMSLGDHSFRIGLTTHVWYASGWMNCGTVWADWGTVQIKYPTRNYSVFVSHSVRDMYVVDTLSHLLDVYGITSIVAEREIKAGTPLSEKIAKQIDASDSIVAFLTIDGSNSEWVSQELGYAKKAGKLVIPIAEEGVKVKGFIEGLEYIKFDRNKPYEAFVALNKYVVSAATQKEEQGKQALLALAFLGLLLLLAASSKE